MFLAIQLVQALFEPNFSLIERQDHRIIISFVVVTGFFNAFVGSAKLSMLSALWCGNHVSLSLVRICSLIFSVPM
jgi:hypothetical protein